MLFFFAAQFTSAPCMHYAPDVSYIAERGMVFHHAALAIVNIPFEDSGFQFYSQKYLVRNIVFTTEPESRGR